MKEFARGAIVLIKVKKRMSGSTYIMDE